MLKIEIDEKELIQEVYTAARKTFMSGLTSTIQSKLKLLFGEASGKRRDDIRKQYPDYGLMTSRVDEVLTECFLDDEGNTEKVKAVIHKYWDDYLEAATKKMLEHRANRIAWSQVNNLPRYEERKD